ncbi:MAG: tetratricopeptide repeat protein [Hydrogenophaga sp.]|jgi:tetratricopeptide (TPR) repeat protein|nr:tetratricopeptide repeat protein [Hydrogenophaga sp.]
MNRSRSTALQSRVDAVCVSPSLPGAGLIATAVLAISLVTALPAVAQTAPSAPPSTPEPVVNSPLTAPLFYQILLGELQLRSGDPGAGYSLMLDAARRQRDASLYQRAVEMALQSRSGEAALSAARDWSTALPGDLEARRFHLQILLALNRVSESGPVLRELIGASAAADRDDVINAIPPAYARVPDKDQALTVVREALRDSLRDPARATAAWTTLGRLELGLERFDAALQSAAQGHQANRSSPLPAMLALELLERGRIQAEPIIRAYLVAPVTDVTRRSAVVLGFARILLDLQRTTDARSLLDELTRTEPGLAEPWLLLATLQVQENALPAATRSLETYMSLARQAEDERTTRGRTQAYLLMAQIAERQGDFSAATAWLDRIENAEDMMAAQLRRASLLARQGQLDQARALLRQQPERRPDDARLKLLAEAQLLRDLKQYQAAYEVFGEAVARFPQESELLYDQAMMAEKAGKADEMERLLRRLIALKPDHHHAYNALGYSLADRNTRLDEAKALIEKAVALAPTDAYIQDSLGWVEFRLGNTRRALDILQAAYRSRPDAEIAAHLGEVHWVLGQRDQAMRIWREGLLLANDNETLQETLRRFRVTP